MGNYLKTPGGEKKHYNNDLNILFNKIGQLYGDGTRRSGIYYIIKDVPNSKISQAKKMLRNKKKVVKSYIEDSYMYKIHKENYVLYAQNIVKTILDSDCLTDFVRQKLLEANSDRCLETILKDGINSLNILADLNIDKYSYKAQEIIQELQSIDTEL